MWSLSVEVTFYLALPILALLARRLPVRARVPAIAALAVASWFWGWIPFAAPAGLNPLNWPPAFFSWFAAGMLLAEWVHSPLGWPHRLARRRVVMAVVVVVAYLVAASPLAGPEGLVPAPPAQFTVKTAMGALVAAAWSRRWCWTGPTPAIGCWAPRPMVTLGRWSYGIFVWHLAALAMVFPVIGEFSVQRAHARGAGADADLRVRDRRGELCARRIAVPRSVAALGISQKATARAGARQRRQPAPEDAIAP